MKRRWVLIAAPLLALVVAASVLVVLQRRQPEASTLPDDLFVLSSPEGSFADDDHAFVVLGRCSAEECETWVGVTDDAGRSWRAAIVPGLTFGREGGPTVPRGRLVALDAQTAIIEGFHDSPWGAPDHHRWYTGDGGRTWAQVPVQPVATVDALPQDADLWADTAGDGGGRLVIRVIRHDGTSAVLATPPQSDYQISELHNPIRTTADGALWVQAGGDGRLSIFVSRNRGRSWRELPLPDGAPQTGHSYSFHEGDGRTVYLLDPGAFRAWRSSDGGETWAEFEPVDASVLQAERRPYFGFDTANGREGFGITGRDGSWTPLPFPCRDDHCR